MMTDSLVRDAFARDAAKIHPDAVERTLLEADGWIRENSRSRSVRSFIHPGLDMRVSFITDPADPHYETWYGIEAAVAIGAYAKQHDITLIEAYGMFAKTQARMRGEGALSNEA